MRVRAYVYVRAYVAGRAQRTHSDRRDYEVGLRGAHQLPSYNKRRKKRGKNLLSLRQVYTAVQRRSASALSIAIYSFLLFLHPLSLGPDCLLPFCPVAPRFFLHLLPLLFLFSITVGVARQPVHRGQANFLPAVILFRPSRSLRPGLTRPLRRTIPLPCLFPRS